MKTLSGAIIISAAFALTACSSSPTIPQSSIVTVEKNIQMAKEESAYTYAPLAINSAEQHLADAKRAMERDDKTTALWKIEKAKVDSEYALALTDAEKAQEASDQLSQSLESLNTSYQ